VTEEVSKKLSRRELLILRALIEGASDRAIAEKLVLRESTVKKLVQTLLRKLDVRNRARAAKWARDKLGDV
jgi:DNA-binding NarL/FixJ family response regulator